MLDGTGNFPASLVFATAKLKGRLLGVPELGGPEGHTKAASHFLDADGL